MNARTATVLFLALFLVAPSLLAKEAKAEFKVSGMSCGMCAKGVEATLARLEGVKSAEVSYDKGSATIVYDDEKVTEEKLKETIKKSGYKAERKARKESSQ